jgi:hypothetical protein
MQARIVSVGRGARWLGQGWQIFRAAPLGWLAMVFAYVFITQVIALVPYVGWAAALMVVPAFTVGLMSAARAVAAGGRLEFGALLDGFRHGARSQLALGMIYLVCFLLALSAGAAVDGESAVQEVLSGKRKPQELDPADLLAPAAAFAAVYSPVMMLFWFAPLLAAWHGAPVAKALFYSFFACLLNWRAFLAYGAVAAAVMLVVPFILLSIVVLATGGAAQRGAGSLMFPVLFLLLPTLYASFYASYRDVFATPQSEAV